MCSCMFIVKLSAIYNLEHGLCPGRLSILPFKRQ